jgi:hypothetical protein
VSQRHRAKHKRRGGAEGVGDIKKYYWIAIQGGRINNITIILIILIMVFILTTV